MTEVQERIPAQVFPLAEFLSDEIVARGWTTADVSLQMSDTEDEFSRNLLLVDLLLCVHKDGLLMSDKTFSGLAPAFGIDEQFFRNIDATWRRWPDRRSEFKPPESIFGPISRRGLFHIVK